MNKLDIKRLTTYKWSLSYDGFLLGHIIADPFCDVCYGVSLVDGYYYTVDSGFWSAIAKANEECAYILDRLRAESDYMANSTSGHTYVRLSVYEVDITHEDHILCKVLYDTAHREYAVYVGAHFESLLCTFPDLDNISDKLRKYLASAKARFNSENVIIGMYGG